MLEKGKGIMKKITTDKAYSLESLLKQLDLDRYYLKMSFGTDNFGDGLRIAQATIVGATYKLAKKNRCTNKVASSLALNALNDTL
jgi:hypothetical protein